MQSSTRIDELRAKFHENPRRYFAPLANEYRKAGDPEQAIAICRAHLAQQPGHMSGHVVYAQALHDARRIDEARTVFEQALALDPENVVVLRHLGDIAREKGDTVEARHWYSRGLTSDPHDTEIAAYLAELTEPLSVAEAVAEPVAEPIAEPVAEPATELVSDPIADPVADPVADPIADPVADPVADPIADPIADPVADPIADPVADPVAEPLAGVVIEPFVDPEPAVVAAAEAESPPVSVSSSEPVDIQNAVAPGGTATPDDSRADDTTPEEFPDSVRNVLAHDSESGSDDFGESGAETDTGIPTAGVRSAPEAADDANTETAPFITRTMAELYETQGHSVEALDIYRQLASKYPDDAAIIARIAALSEPVADTMRANAEAADAAPERHFTETELSGDKEVWDVDDWATGLTGAEPTLTDGAGTSGEFAPDEVEDEATDDAESTIAAADAEVEVPADEPPYAHVPQPATTDQLAASVFDSPQDDLIEAETVVEPRIEPSGESSGDPDYAGAESDSSQTYDGVPRTPTMREFFALLGARRPGDSPTEFMSAHSAVATETAAEDWAGDAGAPGEVAPVGLDAFDNLFPSDAVSGDDSRAAFALSGAVGGPLPPWLQPTPEALAAEQEKTSQLQMAANTARDTPGGSAASDGGQESEEDIRKFREWLDGLSQS